MIFATAMRLRLPYIFSLLILFWLGTLETQAQEQVAADSAVSTSAVLPVDSTGVVKVEPEEASETPPPFFQASLNLDYGKLGTTLIGLDEKYEAGLTMIFFNQYYLLGEYGMAKLEPENAFKNGRYLSEGSYYRVGGGFLKQLNAKSRLGLGVMYAASQFQDEGAIFISSPTGVQDDYNRAFERKNLSARWLEVMITSENRLVPNKENPDAWINQLFAVGFYLRARFLSTYDRFEPIDVYTIPGYGRTVNNPNLALNLYLKMYVF